MADMTPDEYQAYLRNQVDTFKFDWNTPPDMSKENFWPEEWALIQMWFTAAIQHTVLPPGSSTYDLYHYCTRLDKIGSLAGPLAGKMEGKFAGAKGQREVAEAEVYLHLSNNPPMVDPDDKSKGVKKLTVKEIESFVTVAVATPRKDEQDKVLAPSFTQVERATNERHSFMKALIGELSRKSDRLPVIQGLLKLEMTHGNPGAAA